MISDDRLMRAVNKASCKGVTTRTIQRLLRLAGCNRVRDLSLTRRRDFLELLTVLRKQGGQP